MESTYQIMADNALAMIENGQQFTPREVLIMRDFFAKFEDFCSSKNAKLMNYIN